MKVINQYVEFLTPIDGEAMLRQIEVAGRTCYKSEDKISGTSAEKLCANFIKMGHESPLEHASFGVRFVTNRAVTHQIVRHRIAAYAQESQRYCNYSKGKFGSEITFIAPINLGESAEADQVWTDAMQDAEKSYFQLLELGWRSEEARAVLPNSTKTELCMTANIREWRHFLKLRCGVAADPQIRDLANQLLTLCKDQIPILFDDIQP